MEYLLGGILGGIGAGILFLLKHYVIRDSNRRDRRDQAQEEIAGVHVTNQGKQIDADQAAFMIVSERLKLVEERVEKLHDDLTSQREMNAKKDAKIEHLEQDNQRLRERCTKQDKEIADLRIELNALKLLVQLNGTQQAAELLEQKGTAEDPIHVAVHEKQ